VSEAHAGSTTTLFNIATSWDYFSGTSMAAPHVTAAAALVLQANPRLTSAQLAAVLTSTASDLGNQGYDNTFGYGLVDAKAAVQKALAP
jgi:serine protease